MDIPPSSYTIDIDPDRMKQVFINIVTNAMQAMPDGGKINIRIDQKGDYIRFFFSDTGTGIDDKIKNKIFDPFFTTKTKGIGLGMPIVYDIVEKHGGKIEVFSKKGKGTTFIIYLPKVF